MSEKMDINECAKMLAEKLPDGRRIYDRHMEIHGKVLMHVLAGDIIDLPLVKLLKADDSPDIIKLYCGVIEEMWRKGDDNVVNVVEVTVLEYLTDDGEVWQRFGKYISHDFRCYINNEFIPEISVYIEAEKLKGK